MKAITLTVGAFLLLALVVVLVSVMQTKYADGSALSGSVAVQSVATTTVVGPWSKTIFSKSTSCTARTIALSDGSGIGIRFVTGDPSNGNLSSTTLTNTVGLNQVGSTTVTYDGGLNGCGRWNAIASASTTVTLVEYQ